MNENFGTSGDQTFGGLGPGGVIFQGRLRDSNIPFSVGEHDFGLSNINPPSYNGTQSSNQTVGIFQYVRTLPGENNQDWCFRFSKRVLMQCIITLQFASDIDGKIDVYACIIDGNKNITTWGEFLKLPTIGGSGSAQIIRAGIFAAGMAFFGASYIPYDNTPKFYHVDSEIILLCSPIGT